MIMFIYCNKAALRPQEYEHVTFTFDSRYVGNDRGPTSRTTETKRYITFVHRKGGGMMLTLEHDSDSVNRSSSFELYFRVILVELINCWSSLYLSASLFSRSLVLLFLLMFRFRPSCCLCCSPLPLSGPF